MSSLLFWIGIGSAAFHLILGLNLYSNNTNMQTSGFTLICDVEGGPINTLIAINDPSGSPAASCFQPPAGCGSAVGNTFHRDITGGTFTVNVLPSNIHVTNSLGSWRCTDGTLVDNLQVNKIVSYTAPKIWKVALTVTVRIDCIYPYPDEVKIDYVKKFDQSVVETKTDVTFVNSTASNCPVVEARAISMEGTFTQSTIVLNTATEIEIVVTVLLNGTELVPRGSSNFTFTSVSSTTTAIPSTTTSTNNTTVTLKTWQIILIAAGSVLIIVCIIVFVVKKTRNKKELNVEETEQTGQSKSDFPMSAAEKEKSENTPKTE